MNRKGLFLLIFSVSIAITITWLNSFWLSYKDFVSDTNEKQFDYHLSDFSLLQTSNTGEMKYYLEGQHLTHKNTTGGSEIFNPLIQINDSDDKLLFIQAKKAFQKKSQGDIELSGSVLIKKLEINDQKTQTPQPNFKLETEKLVFNPIKKELSSDTDITLTSKDGLLTGTGLYGKLDQQELRILSNVHAKFDPNP